LKTSTHESTIDISTLDTALYNFVFSQLDPTILVRTRAMLPPKVSSPRSDHSTTDTKLDCHSFISPTKYSRGQTYYIASLLVELLTFVFDEAVALETGPLTLSSVCLHWSRIVYNVPCYWSLLVIHDTFSTQRVKEMLRMAKDHFETIRLY